MAASRGRNLHCFPFLARFNEQTAFLGSTPERLWRRRGVALRTEALAGTVANHDYDAQAQQRAAWVISNDQNHR